MPHYILYFPGKSGSNPAHFAAVGLGDLLRPDDLQPGFFECLTGAPDDGTGIFASWTHPTDASRNPRMGYFPKDQEWVPVPADPVRKLPAGRYWFGREIGRPVLPRDLARSVQLPGIDGNPALLDDGQEWAVPNCMALPHKYRLNQDGELEQVVKSQWLRVYDRCLWGFDVAQKMLTGEETSVTDDEILRYCAEMLGLNYRINFEISHMLGLWDKENWQNVLFRVGDAMRMRTIIEDVKKKVAALTRNG